MAGPTNMAKWWAAGFAVVGFGIVSTMAMIASQSSPNSPSEKKASGGAEQAKASALSNPATIEPEPPSTVSRGKFAPAVLPTPRIADAPTAGLPRRLASIAAEAPVEPQPPTRPPGPTGPAKIRREGTELVDVSGVIRRQGNRMEFAPADGSAPMTILENQLLQRVDQSVGYTGVSRWTVSGTVTEYRNINYLLLSRAFLNR